MTAGAGYRVDEVRGRSNGRDVMVIGPKGAKYIAAFTTFGTTVYRVGGGCGFGRGRNSRAENPATTASVLAAIAEWDARETKGE